MDAFGEALGVVPIVHLPVTPGQNVLLVGKGSGTVAEIALRYPTTASILTVEDPLANKDSRVQNLTRIDQVPQGWASDLAIVVVPNVTESLVNAVRQRHRAQDGVVVFAIMQPGQVRAARDLVQKYWSVVQPYREHLPGQAAPQWFLMAGNHGFKRHRPVPGWTSRLTDKYLPVLFTFSKDEVQMSSNRPAA